MLLLFRQEEINFLEYFWSCLSKMKLVLTREIAGFYGIRYHLAGYYTARGEAGERVNCGGLGARMSQSVFTISIKHKKSLF